MATEWYCFASGATDGPMSAGEAASRISASKEDIPLVWRDGMADWTPADAVADFASLFGAARPAAPLVVAPVRDDRRSGFDEYFWDKGKLFRLILGGSFLIFGTLIIVFAPTGSGAARVFGVFAFLFFVLGLALMLGRLFQNSPALVLSPEGFTSTMYSPQSIRWAAVRQIKRTKASGSDVLFFTIDKSVAALVQRPMLARLFQQITGRTTAVAAVSLSLLAGDPNAIAEKCAAYCDAAQLADRQAALERGETSAPVTDAPAPAMFAHAFPWLTYGLLALIAVIYGLELNFAVNANSQGSPSVLTLAYLGGSIGSRVWIDHEWWRLFTAPLMHAGPAHLLLNGVVLWSAGTALERFVGWRWLGAIFAASALGGSIASVFINAPNVVGVGASGAIMGLLAAVFCVSFRLQEANIRTQLQIRAAQTVVPALLPLFPVAKGLHVDYAAHLGGLVAGTMLAVLMLKLWPRSSIEPRFGAAAAMFAVMFIVVAAGAVYPIIELRSR